MNNVSRIPKFNSYKEEAEFWDTHSIADYLDEFEFVKGKYIPEKEPKDVMSIRVTPSLKRKVEKVAKVYEISPSSLVRMWMADKIREAAAEYNIKPEPKRKKKK